MPDAQKWLDSNYPCNCDEKTKKSYFRHECSCPRKTDEWKRELNFRNLDLSGNLDLEGFDSPSVSAFQHYKYTMNYKKVHRYSSDYLIILPLKIYLAGNPQLGEIKNRSFWVTLVYQNSQEFLNHQHSDKIQIETIDLSNLEFEQPDELILNNYPNLKKIEKKVGEWNSNITKITISNCPQLEIVDIGSNNKELALNNLPNLKRISCHGGRLTTLDLTNCPNLQKINCYHHHLTEIKFPLTAGEKLEELDLSYNNFNQDLSFLSHLVNLKELKLGNNKFRGSLKFLKNMSKLEKLDISSNDDINNDLDYLPNGIKNLFCLKGTGFKLIPYEQFEIEKNEWGDNKVLGEGRFGKVYKAKWTSENNKSKIIALKSLNDSQNIKTKFLQEIANHKLFSSNRIVKCFGVSQDPETKNYLMVMAYIKDGNLQQFSFNNQLDFRSKLTQLWRIASGLKSIHKQGLIHQDFHSGNILNDKRNKKGAFVDVHCFITDLGLCQPANEENQEESIYGVLPYVAPEVLRKKKYTQASDVYSFGIVAYEVLSGLPPYCDVAHDNYLWLKIHDGLRPKFKIKIPLLLEELIKQCWDANASNRPSAIKLEKSLHDWLNEIKYEENTEFYRQVQETEPFNQNLPLNTANPQYTIHPSAFYTSRLLDFKSSTEPQNSQATNDEYYSQSLNFDLNSNNEIVFNELFQKNEAIKNPASENKRRLLISAEVQKKAKSIKLNEGKQSAQILQTNLPNWQNK